MKPNMMMAHEESCLKIEISYPTDKSVGFLSFTLANKKGGYYDWENGVRVDLDVLNMARVQQVLHGECESLDVEIGETKFLMRHLVDPGAYAIGIMNKNNKSQIILDPHEALAIAEAMTTAFFFVSFVKGVC